MYDHDYTWLYNTIYYTWLYKTIYYYACLYMTVYYYTYITICWKFISPGLIFTITYDTDDADIGIGCINSLCGVFPTYLSCLLQYVLLHKFCRVILLLKCSILKLFIFFSLERESKWIHRRGFASPRLAIGLFIYLCLDDFPNATPGDEFAQIFREMWSRVKFCCHSPSLNSFISGWARAVSRNSPVTKLNLFVANVMENGYANIAKFSSVASLPCEFANVLALVETTQRYASKIKKKKKRRERSSKSVWWV